MSFVTIKNDDGDQTTNNNMKIAEGEDDAQGSIPPAISSSLKLYNTGVAILTEHTFLFGLLFSIFLAFLYPPLGAVYLVPSITSSYLSVMFIFLLSGIGLKTSALWKASQRVQFNVQVQAFNFLLVSLLTFILSLMLSPVVGQTLSQGLVLCSCLPVTVNMAIVMTKSAGGDESAAIFNSAAGNLLGVIATPVLASLYQGNGKGNAAIDLGSVVAKLAVRVLLPLAAGQILQYRLPALTTFMAERKVFFKRLQEAVLCFIVYAVFSETFLEKGIGAAGVSDHRPSDASAEEVSPGQVFLLIFIEGLWLCFLMFLAWKVFGRLCSSEPELRIFAVFGGTQKTIATGIPLIAAMYGEARAGAYTVPLLIWHPLQLVIGSAISAKMAKWGRETRERLNMEEEAKKNTSNSQREGGDDEFV